MALPNLYGGNRAAIAKINPKESDFWGGQDYPNPGNGMEDGMTYPGGSATFDESAPANGFEPWQHGGGFGGAGTDPSVGSPGFSMPTVEGGGPAPWTGNTSDTGIDWGKIFGNGSGSSGMTPQQAAYLAAATGMAGKQWNDAGKIENRFNQVADDADYLHPDRVKYAGQLAGLMADPSQIENDPAYKFRLAQGLGTLGHKSAAQGGGYSNAAQAMIDYAGQSASQELDAQTQRLSNLAGFQFDQGRTAADLRTAGLTGSIASQNAALGTLGFGLQNAFGTQGTGLNNGNGNGNGNGSNGNGNGRGNGNGSGNGSGTGNQGNGTWNKDGTYRTPDGRNIDVAAVSAAARAGSPEAIAILKQISGGDQTDRNIEDLGRGWDGGNTGDPYNPGGGYDNGYIPTDPPSDWDTGFDGFDWETGFDPFISNLGI